MRPVEELRYLILGLQREGDRLLTAHLRPLGLTTSQAEVLRVLADHAPLTLLGLGELLICENGSPSRLVDRLVSSGLVHRNPDPDDRRRVTLTLTDDGHRQVDAIIEIEERLHTQLDELVRDAPLTDALALLRQLAAAFPVGAALDRRSHPPHHPGRPSGRPRHGPRPAGGRSHLPRGSSRHRA